MRCVGGMQRVRLYSELPNLNYLVPETSEIVTLFDADLLGNTRIFYAGLMCAFVWVVYR